LIRVKYYSVFRSITGRASEELTCEGSMPIKDFLNQVAVKYGHRMRARLLDETGAARHNVMIVVNSKVVERLRNGVAELHDGDEVSIFPAMGGGSLHANPIAPGKRFRVDHLDSIWRAAAVASTTPSCSRNLKEDRVQSVMPRLRITH